MNELSTWLDFQPIKEMARETARWPQAAFLNKVEDEHT